MRPDDDPVATAERLIAEGRAAEAATRLQDLLASGHGGLLSRTTLAKALIASGDTEQAVATARETAMLNPDAAVAAASLGEALLAAENLATAIGEFQRALQLDPRLTQARFLLGRAWLAAGEAEKALEAFSLIADEDAPQALMSRIDEANAMRARPRSDPRYVRHLFDEFSTSYDSRMVEQLAYGAPAILRELASMLGLVEPNTYTVLDLGCGTGLAGLAFKDLARTLVGVDLSPAMIEKARARGIYDSLIVRDIEEWLASEAFDPPLEGREVSYDFETRMQPQIFASPLVGEACNAKSVSDTDVGEGLRRVGGAKSHWRACAPTPHPAEVSTATEIAVPLPQGEREIARAAPASSSLCDGPAQGEGANPAIADGLFDLILAADTLVYLGDLENVFTGVARKLATGGLFLFTVEKSAEADFDLGPKRRWRHAESYLRSLAARSGLDVSGLLACHPRNEAGVPVEGLAVALRKGLAEKVG